MKITIAGTGYVGLSLATLLARQHEVIALDIIQEKVDMINKRISPLKEEYIEKFFKEENLNLFATTNKEFAYKNCELVIIATPTNYDEHTNYFDTSSVEDAIENVLKYNKEAIMVIKSTIPVGYVESMRYRYGVNNIYFSPEFLREGKSLYDNLYPSRIVVGDKGYVGQMFSKLLKEAAIKEDIPVLLTGPTEAEAIKLFANTYLATRVAYFNELDNYAIANRLNTEDIIKGICYDPRIGNYYNNPSFGYGGYCLPKDVKQLNANFKASKAPCSLISSISNSNEQRKKYIADLIAERTSGTIGIYKTAMKANSDNNRSSSIIDIIKQLRVGMGREVIVYDPQNDLSFLEDIWCKVYNDFDAFVSKCDIIVASRLEENLEPYRYKVFTRDIFGNN